jgi:hypothetical protein
MWRAMPPRCCGRCAKRASSPSRKALTRRKRCTLAPAVPSRLDKGQSSCALNGPGTGRLDKPASRDQQCRLRKEHREGSGSDPLTSSLQGGGQRPAHRDNNCRSFAGLLHERVSMPLLPTASEGVARRRCASRVPQKRTKCLRVFYEQTTTQCQFAGTLCKPSDGLEPSTPSLPWRFRERHGRTRAITRDTVWPGNPTIPGGPDASRGVARVVSDVSVLCPRAVVRLGNSPSAASSDARPPA